MTTPEPDWPLDDVPAWRSRAEARLYARPGLLGGLVAEAFVPAVVDKALGYFCYEMASAGSPPAYDMTAAWVCLNAKRSGDTSLKIAYTIFNLPATYGLAEGKTP